MKIYHLSNSFIIIETQNAKICCDPWVGRANYGGWHSFPEFEKKYLINFLKDVDIIYISHLHDDHLDTEFLKQSGLNKKKFLIKNFTFKTLLNRLKSIGVKEIFELEPYEIFSYADAKMSILPQMSTNSSELDEDVEYDIDTSFIISSEKEVFFNQVDNPYSTKDYITLANWIKINYGEITIAALMAGAASEYPHTFLNINRKEEKEKIVQNVLRKLIEKLDILKPLYYFPAGGTYFIPGKFYRLNPLIAQPTINQIEETLSKSNNNVKFLHLEGGKSVFFDMNSNNHVIVEDSFRTISCDIEKSILSHKEDLYDYEFVEDNITFTLLNEIFNFAKLNWEEVLIAKNIKIEQDIEFIIYSSLNLTEDNSKINEQPIGILELKSNLTECKGLLKIHMDLRSMYLCLIRKKVWNGTIGALCLFERIPNVFYPSVTFSLNYLIINNFQKETLNLN
jgi:UDP-MurNAc hydroxylase